MHRYTVAVISLLFLNSLYSHEEFATKIVSSDLITNETEIDYYVDNTLIGFVSFTKVPLCNMYAIHSFYIYPKYRNKGYGKKLLAYTCNHVKDLGARKIYIQPGPFEIVDGRGENITDETREERIQKLIKLYKEAKFNFVNPFTSRCAYVLYKILRISENSEYLMVHAKA